MQLDMKKMEKVVLTLQKKPITIKQIMKMAGISKETAHRWIRTMHFDYGHNIQKVFMSRPVLYYIDDCGRPLKDRSR